jgi:hypothetical protein
VEAEAAVAAVVAVAVAVVVAIIDAALVVEQYDQFLIDART